MDFFEAVNLRRSVREFSDKPLIKETIEKIVDCARLAPTARKVEPWEFIAVTDKFRLKSMADITDTGKFIEASACAIAVVCGDTKYYLEDGCAATENMLLASTALGVGSCWVAGDKKSYCQKMLEFLGAKQGWKLVSIIALGYPADKAVPHNKKPLQEVLRWDRSR